MAAPSNPSGPAPDPTAAFLTSLFPAAAAFLAADAFTIASLTFATNAGVIEKNTTWLSVSVVLLLAAMLCAILFFVGAINQIANATFPSPPKPEQPPAPKHREFPWLALAKWSSNVMLWLFFAGVAVMIASIVRGWLGLG